MCGIFGYWSKTPLAMKSILQTSTNVWQSMSRRGPDGFGGVAIGPADIINFDHAKSYSEGASLDLVLLHTRLAVVGLGTQGVQPMADSLKRYWTVFNGEIYNFKHLRKELELLGEFFEGNSDTEVIVKGFARWGISLFKMLEGMFAIAIFDANTRKLFLARDRVGIKPLYYTQNEKNQIIFASEQQALIDSTLVTPSPNWSGVISNYQFNGALRPSTVYKDIYAIRPGHYLTISDNGIEDCRYAQIVSSDMNLTSHRLDFDAAISNLDKITSKAIRSTLDADVEVATLLSGGIDSAMIAAYASEYLEGLKAYSLVWPQGSSNTESEYIKSKEIARTLNLDHRVVTISEKDVEDSFEEIFDLYEEPMGMIEPHFFIARALRKDGIKVVLNGIGPDETLGGYGWYQAQEKFMLLKKYAFIFNAFKFSSFKNKKRAALFNSGDWFEFYSTVFQRFQLSSDDIFSEKISSNGQWKSQVFSQFGDDCPVGMSNIQYINYLDLMVYVGTHHNHSCDKFLMHEGVEGRFPYLDNEWLNFTFSLPDNYKRRDGQSKFIWHKLSEKFFPKNYFLGQKKGFGVPNDFLMKSKKINLLFSSAIMQLKNKGIIRSDIDFILEKINPQEVFSLKMYFLSLNMWLNKL